MTLVGLGGWELDTSWVTDEDGVPIQAPPSPFLKEFWVGEVTENISLFGQSCSRQNKKCKFTLGPCQTPGV